MKNSLKDFINRHRDAFDDKIPGSHVWERISSRLHPGKPTAWWDSLRLWRIAAMLLLGLSVFLLWTQRQTVDAKRLASQVRGEFLNVESYYRQEIARKVALIDGFSDSWEKDQFVQDFQKLDAMYQVLRDELQSHPSEKVRDALILNILVRIDLLNQQIKKLEDSQANPEEDPTSL